MDCRLELHRARVKNGIDLARISGLTALHPGIVAKIDEGRFDELPPGIYARSYVRAFAEAVGLNPHHALVDLEPLLPAEPDPLPALREHAPASTMESIRSFLATQAASAPLVRRAAVAAIDAILLLGVGAVMTTLAAWICGVGIGTLLEQAGGELAAMFSVPIALYFILLERMAGRTLGESVFGAGGAPSHTIVVRITPLSPRAAPSLARS